MISLDHLAGQTVAVLGLGRTGLSVCCALQSGGAKCVAWDDNPRARKLAEELGITTAELSRLDTWSQISRLIVSPGIPHLYPEPHEAVIAAQRAGIVLDNDIGLFFGRLAQRAETPKGRLRPVVVAVTGTNGKSTTAALTAHLLSGAGLTVGLAGNIGRPVLDLDELSHINCIVLEVSSYQAELAACLDPDIAVFLNLTPDHLLRHGGPGGYFAAKRQLFEGNSLRVAVIGSDEMEGRFLATRLRSTRPDCLVHEISIDSVGAERASGATFGPGYIEMRNVEGLSDRLEFIGNPSLAGAHNAQNAAAAALICHHLELSASNVGEGLGSFPGLPHRMQHITCVGGIKVVNDSKATNSVSAAKALASHSSILWIAGGEAKEGGISSISDHFANVRKAFLIGSCARDFARQLGDVPRCLCGSMDVAVARAVEEARAGDTILLSPAAASFDQYSSFEARGEHFARLARTMLPARGKQVRGLGSGSPRTCLATE